MLGGQLSPSLCSNLLSPIALQAQVATLNRRAAGWARSCLVALLRALQPLHLAPQGAAGGRCGLSPAPRSLALQDSPSPPPEPPVPRPVQTTSCYIPGMSRGTPQALRSQHRLPWTVLLEVSFAGPRICFIALISLYIAFAFLKQKRCCVLHALFLLLFGWLAEIPC